MSTAFDGAFEISPPLLPAHRRYLEEFSTTRRMSRDPMIVGLLPDPKRTAADLPIGAPDAGYYTGPGEEGVLDCNRPPVGQPGLWCQWTPGDDGTELFWNGEEKFMHYVEWLEFLLQNFLIPWGYVLSGVVTWEGDEKGDTGTIYIKKNRVQAIPDEISSPAPKWGDEVVKNGEECDLCGGLECECCHDCEEVECTCNNEEAYDDCGCVEEAYDDCGCVECECGEEEEDTEP